TNIVRGAAITTTGTGPLAFTLNPGGILTSTEAGAISLDGSFTESGAATANIAGSITTTNDNISFSSPIAMTGPVSFDTGAGIGDITVTTIDGAQPLTMTAGTGSITASGAIGGNIRIGALTVNSCTNFTGSGLTAASVDITETGGTVHSNGNINTNTAAGITLNANNIIRGGSITATNGGPLIVTFSGTSTAAGPFPINVGSVSLTGTGPSGVFFGGTVTTDTGGIDLHSPVTFLADGIADTSISGGDIHFFSTVNGAKNVTLIAGAGNILFDGVVGGTTPLATMTITSANNVTAASAVSAASIVQTAGAGKTTFGGAVTTTNAAGISLTGNQVELDGAVTTTTGGPLSINHTGLLTIGTGSSMSLDGAFSELGGGNVSLGANITTTNDPISWADPITLTHDATLNSGAGAGDITFTSTIDGPFCLTVLAGTGTVQFSGAVGLSTPLNCISATGATIAQNSTAQTATTVNYTGAIELGGGITTADHDITLNGNVQVANDITLTTGAGAGDISITGNIDGDVSGRNLTLAAGTGSVTVGGTIGGTVHLNNLTITGNDITWGNLGTTGIGSSSTTVLNAANSITFTGTNYNNGALLFTAGSSFIFDAAAPVTLTSSNLPITFTTGTIQLAAGTPLTMNSNGGNIAFGNLTVADAGLTNLTVNAITGSMTFTQIGTAGFPLNAVDLTASTFTPTPSQGTNVFSTSLSVNTPTITTLSGAVSIPGTSFTYANPVVLNGNVTITFASCPVAGTLIFNQSLDADVFSRTLAINACGQVVTFNGPVGAITPFTSISIDQASDVNINSIMNTGSLAQTMGTGTTTIASALSTTGAGGISLETSAISVNGSIETTGGGPVTFNNSGAVTVPGADINVDGAFQQTGAGSVSIGGTIRTTDDPISFASAVSLSADLNLNSVSSTGAAITFNDKVDGAHILNIAAGSGTITLTGAVGSVTPLQKLTLTSAGDVNAGAVSAASIVQTIGTGKTTFSGAVTTTNVAGISLTGSQFELDGAVTTTNNGPLLIHNSQTLKLIGGGSISGALTQTGLGGVTLAGTTSAGAAVSFASAVTLNGTTNLDTSANGSNITFSSTLDGTQNLTLNLGNTGNLLFGGAVGGTPLGVLTITNAGNVNASTISAASITQSAGHGISTLGSLTTSATGGISLTGTAFVINGNLITTALGPVSIIDSAALTLNGGAGTSITGAFSQSGGGAVSLSGTLTTVNQPMSFTNAVSLTGTTALSTGAGAGTITFSSTLDGNQNLTLTAGTGNIVFGGAIGSLTALGALTVQSCTDITYPNTKAVSVTQNASSGTTTLSSPIATTGTSGISLTGTTITQSSSLSSIVTDPISIAHTGVYTMGGTISSGGAFTESGLGGTVQLNGSITSASNNVSFANAITLTGPSSISTSAGGGNILLSSTVDGNNNLSLTAGAGSITFGGDVGGGTRIGILTINSGAVSTTQGISAASISQMSGSGTFGVLNTNQAAGILLQGTTFTLAGNVTTTGAGALTIQNTGALVVSGTTFSIAGAVDQTGLGTTTLSSAITAGGVIPSTSTGI
ncbi:MAG: S-layer family protein, partial [Verrucomicrobia bacterium]|nr:S-layer family protein [Verrucomicrobiota bacterium]